LYVQDPADGSLIELLPDPQSLFPQDYTKPTTFYSGGGGLVSTADDYARFAQMILNGGDYNGARILKPETVALLTKNQVPSTITPQVQRAFAFTGEGMRWSLASAVITDSAASGWASGRTITWGGLGGTWFWIDPKNDLFISAWSNEPLMISRSARIHVFSNQAVYAALLNPECSPELSTISITNQIFQAHEDSCPSWIQFPILMDRGDKFVDLRLVPLVDRALEHHHRLPAPALEHAGHLAERLALMVYPRSPPGRFLAADGRGTWSTTLLPAFHRFLAACSLLEHRSISAWSISTSAGSWKK
jgi:hypothetical protein